MGWIHKNLRIHSSYHFLWFFLKNNNFGLTVTTRDGSTLPKGGNLTCFYHFHALFPAPAVTVKNASFSIFSEFSLALKFIILFVFSSLTWFKSVLNRCQWKIWLNLQNWSIIIPFIIKHIKRILFQKCTFDRVNIIFYPRKMFYLCG